MSERHVSRRQRQLDELHALCDAGALARAIDLAFEHFAHFGRDDGIVDLLAVAVEAPQASERVRGRFAELRAQVD